MAVRRGAGVEVLAGVGAFALALLTWTFWLFAPRFARAGYAACSHYYASLVEGGVVGLGSFIRSHPGIFLFILAFLFTAGAVASGACLHGGRRMRVGRQLLYAGSLLLPLLLSAMAALSLPDLAPAMPPPSGYVVAPGPCFQPFPDYLLTAGPASWASLLAVPILALGPGLSTALAIIAAVAASETTDRDSAARDDTRVARVEVLSGLAAFALALVIWALWFFAPVQMVQHFPNHNPNGPGSVILAISVVEGTDGLGNFYHYFPNLAVLILAFLVATGAIAMGAYLHGTRHWRIGRRLLWGGTLLLPLLLSAISLEPLPWLARSLWPQDALPKLGGTGVQMLPSPGVLVLSLGAGLCVVLAMFAAMAMTAMAAADTRRLLDSYPWLRQKRSL